MTFSSPDWSSAMNYTISRDGQEFGPYSLADLQQYVASGNIALTDMARSEGMTDYLPVSQILGTIPVPEALPPVTVANPAVEYPDPPNLHWGLVLLFEFMTFGMFGAAWGIVISAWVRKSDPTSRAIYYYGGWAGTLVLIFGFSFLAAMLHTSTAWISLIQLASIALSLAARFTLRSALEKHYNELEPMGLALSGVMTFFFAVIYFQYHLNDIVRRKRQDREMSLLRA
jgi:magnesium-transporting ATPase (P-type)